jgi:capsular polysaccharide biosynthesis protein
MTVTRPREPILDAEQEVDLGRHARAVATRWWLPLAGLIAGAIVGYLVSLSGTQVWQASATVYLGTPYSSGGTPLVSQQTNPTAVGTIVKSEEAIDKAAAVAHMKPEQLRGKISTQTVTAGTGSVGTTRVQQNPLVKVTVQTPTAREARLTANALARQVVETLSAYPNQKIALLKQRIANDNAQVAALKGSGRSDSAAAISLGNFLSDANGAQMQLVQARTIETPSILTHGAAVRTTARSRRNDVVVGALLGLLLGIIAALAWEPIAGRRARPL